MLKSTSIPRSLRSAAQVRGLATVSDAANPVRRYGGLKDQDRIFTNLFCKEDFGCVLATTGPIGTVRDVGCWRTVGFPEWCGGQLGSVMVLMGVGEVGGGCARCAKRRRRRRGEHRDPEKWRPRKSALRRGEPESEAAGSAIALGLTQTLIARPGIIRPETLVGPRWQAQSERSLRENRTTLTLQHQGRPPAW